MISSEYGWFVRLQQALLDDASNVVIYEIAAEGEAERQHLLRALEKFVDANAELRQEVAELTAIIAATGE